MKKNLFLILCLLALGWTAGVAQSPTVEVPLRFDDYYTYDMAVAALQALHKAYPQLTRLDEVGRSEEGRAIWCMTVNNPETGDPLSKPGVYVDGNIHGNEIQATEVALYLLNYLLTNHGRNEMITSLVDSRCFYVVPMVNVDGRYHFFADANTSSTNRGLRRPKDDDNDGLLDEDFPDDLDGDGNICMMRRRDPHGQYRTDPEDPRLMIRVKPGEKGEWTMLGSEGIDNDEDGRINEDAEGYVDPNRNWGYDWMPPYVQRGSGDYPFSGVGLKALAGFIMERPNICMAWAFHNVGGMFVRGPSTKAQGEFHPDDLKVYNLLGREAEKMVPGYRYIIGWKDLYSTYGDFTAWITNTMGTYAFVGELFARDQERYEQKPDEREIDPDYEEGPRFGANQEETRDRLKFNDNLAHGELYKDWQPYDHPTYGPIEIGGWVKMSSRLPAPFMLKDLVHRNAAAVIYSARQTPEVSMELIGTEALADGVRRIQVRLVNDKGMPSMSHLASQNKLYPQDMLTVAGDGITVVAGGRIINRFTGDVSYKEHRPELQFLTVPGFGTVEYEFLVKGTGPVTVNYTSAWAGSRQMKLGM
jgi:hypothetical protein